MRVVQFEGQLHPVPNPVSHPGSPPPSAHSPRGFLVPSSASEHTPPPGSAAHPLSLGWRHTSSTPPSTQIRAPSLLSPSSPATARGADACPTTVLSQSGSSSGPRLQASPPPCERPARPASAAVSASAAALAFLAGPPAGALGPGWVAGRRGAGSALPTPQP